MKKNLFDPTTAADIIGRMKKLKPTFGRHWGTMEVTEMLLHCTLANNFIFDDKATYVKPTVKQRVMRFVFFNFFSKIPRNHRGPARLQTRNKINEQQFEEQRAAAITSVTRFTKPNPKIASLHAGLGWLSAGQWGTIAYMHMDHHLRQFGA